MQKVATIAGGPLVYWFIRSCFIARMPDVSGNIPFHIFYGSIMLEILRIARSTPHYGDFIPRTADLFERMINQGAAVSKLFKQIDKVVKRRPVHIIQPKCEYHQIRH